MTSPVALDQNEPASDLEPKLKKMLRALLKPIEVRRLVITRSDRYSVRGFVTTVCPIERRESGRDFEVGIAGDEEGTIMYVSVDGRRLHLQETRASRRGSSRVVKLPKAGKSRRKGLGTRSFTG